MTLKLVDEYMHLYDYHRSGSFIDLDPNLSASICLNFFSLITIRLISGTERPMTLKLYMHHQVLEYYNVCSKDTPGLAMTYFTTRSNLAHMLWMGVKTMDFSEIIIGYDIQVGTCSQP